MMKEILNPWSEQQRNLVAQCIAKYKQSFKMLMSWCLRWGEFVYPSSAVPPTDQDLITEDEEQVSRNSNYILLFYLLDQGCISDGCLLLLHFTGLNHWRGSDCWSCNCSLCWMLPLQEEQEVHIHLVSEIGLIKWWLDYSDDQMCNIWLLSTRDSCVEISVNSHALSLHIE